MVNWGLSVGVLTSIQTNGLEFSNPKTKTQSSNKEEPEPSQACDGRRDAGGLSDFTAYHTQPPFRQPHPFVKQKKIAPPKFVNFTYTKFGQNK
ncbi:hypothetical protein HZ326_31497 [Fusarium oxysporum f. sp. albedinis]|nr:hypothetical protein HZ326_31497 [Fusarium oxysporum f. sp. albedinis]